MVIESYNNESNMWGIKLICYEKDSMILSFNM